MPAIAQVLLNITIGKQFAERAAEGRPGSRGQNGQQRTERAADGRAVPSKTRDLRFQTSIDVKTIGYDSNK